jgi:hypothetical protein
MKNEHGMTFSNFLGHIFTLILPEKAKLYSFIGCDNVSYYCVIPVFQWNLSVILYCATFQETSYSLPWKSEHYTS